MTLVGQFGSPIDSKIGARLDNQGPLLDLPQPAQLPDVAIHGSSAASSVFASLQVSLDSKPSAPSFQLWEMRPLSSLLDEPNTVILRQQIDSNSI